MSAVLDRVLAASAGGDPAVNWRSLLEQLHDEHDKATTTEERVQLLEIHDTLMNLIEETDTPEHQIPEFRKFRLQAYHALVLKEAVIGRNVCIEMLDAITLREVAAQRMAPDDELRDLVRTGRAAPHYNQAELEVIASREAKEAAGLTPMGWRGLLQRLGSLREGS